VAAHFAGEPRVTETGISNTELTEVTEENFGQLLDRAAPPDPGEVAAAGVAAGALATLWPFTLAYRRGRISDQQLGAAFTRVLGDAGVALAARVSYALVLGPVFAWYLLARGVLGLTRAAAEIAEEGLRRREVPWKGWRKELGRCIPGAGWSGGEGHEECTRQS